jgi:hypothetical protein
MVFQNVKIKIFEIICLFNKWIKSILDFKLPPEIFRYWSTIYYGARGSGKTLHQGKMTVKTLEYLNWYYIKNPNLPRAIVFTNQLLADKIKNKYNDYLYFWSDVSELKNCPRKNCWRGKNEHRLHGALVIFDDLTNILPPDSWRMTPMWLRKMFLQGRHFGIRILGNMQDPFAVDVNFRRCVDIAYKFQRLFGNSDPDETKKKVNFIFGIYRRRKIKADLLWTNGDIPEQLIRLQQVNKEEQNEYLKKAGKEWAIVNENSWKGSIHFWRRKDTEIYDTTQDVKEYEPQGFIHKEFECIDPTHNHTDPKAENYCKYKKIVHELV